MFAITQRTCTMGKISNNLEKHGEEDVPAWTIPITGILVDLAAIEFLLHDARASEAFFARNSDTDILEPRPWLTYAAPIALTEAYDGMATTIKVGDEELEFDRCRLKDLVLGRFYPGMAQIDCKLQLEPGLDHANLVLQEFQNQPIVLTVLDAKIAAKKKLRQQELPLVQPSEPPAAASEAGIDSNSNVGADDPLYDEAVTFVCESRVTTVGGVQVQLGIDQARASLIMGAMQIAGIVGPVRDDNSRAILVDEEGLPLLQPGETAPGSDDGGDEDDGQGDDDAPVAPDPEPSDAGVWPMAAPGSDELPTSRTGRAVTAHAKRTARKRARAGKGSDVRAH